MSFGLGLLTATVASRIHRAAQPALLYLVPFTLLPLLTMAYLKVSACGGHPVTTGRADEVPASSRVMIQRLAEITRVTPLGLGIRLQQVPSATGTRAVLSPQHSETESSGPAWAA